MSAFLPSPGIMRRSFAQSLLGVSPVHTMLWIVLIIILAVIAFYTAIFAASESGEVVTLATVDSEGNDIETRLWVVEHDNCEWVRTGHPEKGWFLRIRSNPNVEFERAGSRSLRVAVPAYDHDTVRAVNDRFSSKYGAADWIVALSGDAAKRVPVCLEPK